jgi:hypothetical protein
MRMNVPSQKWSGLIALQKFKGDFHMCCNSHTRQLSDSQIPKQRKARSVHITPGMRPKETQRRKISVTRADVQLLDAAQSPSLRFEEGVMPGGGGGLILLGSYQNDPRELWVWLMVKPENHATVRLYRELGFVEAGKCTLRETLTAHGDKDLPPENISEEH